MRPRLSLARGLTLAATLISICSVASLASAAPAKRHKAPKKSAPAAEPAPAAAETEAPKAEEPPAPEVKPAEPVKLEEAATPTQKPVLEAKLPPVGEAHEEPLGAAGDEALGRRERERLAAGRIEVAVTVSAGVGMRYFKYSDAVGTLPVPYRLPVAPMATFGLEAYPLAASNVPVLRDLGFRGRFSRAFAVDSKTPEGVTIETSWTRFSGEVRQRFLIPGSHPLELGAFVGADASYFSMKTEKPVPALLPSTRTVAVRFGLDGSILVAGRFSVLLSAAFLASTTRAQIYERFRGSHLSGIDAELGFALGLIPGLEARATGRYTRYFASFQPDVRDRLVAGGALDQQMQFGLGVRYAH